MHFYEDLPSCAITFRAKGNCIFHGESQMRNSVRLTQAKLLAMKFKLIPLTATVLLIIFVMFHILPLYCNAFEAKPQ